MKILCDVILNLRKQLRKASRNLARPLCFSVLLCLLANDGVMAAQNRFGCGGSVEAEVWALWDSNMRNYMDKRLLRTRLIQSADVFALYNFQFNTHNMVSMARRCNRQSRLLEVARLVRTAYDALVPGTPLSPGRKWVCRDGHLCNDKNGLLNKEIMLCSVQFLALASSVANALASSTAPLGNEEKVFIRDTFQIVIEHLLRWGDDTAISTLGKVAKARPQDVKTGSSALFFTDRSLWLITIYAELAGVIQSPNRQYSGFDGLSDSSKARLRQHLTALLHLFSARVSIQHDPKSRLGNVDLADLDRGFWRLYFDNRYAGYEKNEKPVVCVPTPAGKTQFRMEVRVSADTVTKRQDIGWDISHARRLVHALDALVRNHKAMKSVFSLTDTQLPPSGLPLAFANTLVAVIWNGDSSEPLFSNYWSGANGWYRVGYDRGIGQCREGSPPYGLSDAFPTGGYATWAQYRPVIGLLGQRLYDLISNPDGPKYSFIVKYYPSLSKSARDQERNLSKFMFLPSLVGVADK